MFTRQTNTDKLLHELQTLVEHAEELLAATADDASDAVAEVRSQVEKSLHAARKQIGKLEHRVVKQVRQAAHETDDYVHENPWLAIGAAASAGVVIGVLLARR